MRTSRLVPLLIILIGLLWIFVTDVLVSTVAEGASVSELTFWQMFKGSLFVILIAIISFFIIRHKEQRIHQTDQVFLQLFQANPNPMWIYDIHTLRFLSVNDAAIENYGYTLEEFQSMTILDIRPPAEAKSLRHYLQLEPKQRDMERVWTHITKQGARKQIKTAAFDVIFQGKKGRLVTITDLTKLYEKQQKEIARLQQEQLMKQQLETLINTTDDIMWSIDREKRFLSFNQDFSAWFYRLYEVEPIISDPVLTDKVDQESRAWWGAQYDKVLAGEEVSVTQHFRVEEEEGIDVQFDLLPIRVGGQVVGAACYGRDITFYLQTINDLKVKNEGLHEIAFIGAHELRKPVANLLGLLQVLQTTEMEVKEALPMMLSSADELDRYIRKMINKAEEIGAQGDLDEIARRYNKSPDEEN